MTEFNPNEASFLAQLAQWNIRVGIIGGSGIYKLEGFEIIGSVNPETVGAARAPWRQQHPAHSIRSPGASPRRRSPSRATRRACTSPSSRATA
jgi:hypothetical protein